MRTEPDGFIGAAMAIQGIPDATILLHGQKGCRKGILLSESCMPRSERDRQIDSPFYAGTRGSPYTCVTIDDYNGTSSHRLSEAMSHVSSEDYALKVLVSSPGVSIIGDDLSPHSDERTIVCDRDLFDGTCAHGFDRMMSVALEHLMPSDADIIPGTVNLLGLSVMHKDWRTVRQEMSKFLRDAGLEVVSSPGAGSTSAELTKATTAEYSIVLSPEHCTETSELLNKRGSTIISTGDCPIGFDAILDLYRSIEVSTGCRMDHGRRMLTMNRKRAYESIIASGKNLLGMTYQVFAEPSVSRALSEWLESSFGMVPSSGRPDILFAPGDHALLAERSGECAKGIDIGFPSSSRTDFSKAPVIGIDGALYLLDRMFNRD